MTTGFTGAGALRFLGIVVGIDDRVTRKIGAINARVGALSTAMAGAGRSANLLQGQLALLGFSAAAVFGGMFRQFALFEKQTTLASFALGSFRMDLGKVESSAMSLSRTLRQSPVAMAQLRKEIAQLGEPSAQAGDALAHAAARLAIVTGGEMTSDEAARVMFRLLNITSRTKDELNSAMGASMRFASAIKVAGDASAASAVGVTQMLKRLQAAGMMANFTAVEFIGLAGALSDIDETSREAFSTSLLRIFGKEFNDPQKQKKVAAFLGMDVDTFNVSRINQPMSVLVSLVEALNAQGAIGGDPLGALHEMGFSNVRDARFLSAMSASLKKFLIPDASGQSIFTKIGEEFSTDDLRIIEQSNILINQMAGSWDALVSSLQRFSITVGNMFGPAVTILLKSLTGIIEGLSAVPFLAQTVGAGAMTFAAASGHRLFGELKKAKPMGFLQGIVSGIGTGIAGGGTRRIMASEMWGAMTKQVTKSGFVGKNAKDIFEQYAIAAGVPFGALFGGRTKGGMPKLTDKTHARALKKFIAGQYDEDMLGRLAQGELDDAFGIRGKTDRMRVVNAMSEYRETGRDRYLVPGNTLWDSLLWASFLPGRAVTGTGNLLGRGVTRIGAMFGSEKAKAANLRLRESAKQRKAFYRSMSGLSFEDKSAMRRHAVASNWDKRMLAANAAMTFSGIAPGKGKVSKFMRGGVNKAMGLGRGALGFLTGKSGGLAASKLAAGSTGFGIILLAAELLQPLMANLAGFFETVAKGNSILGPFAGLIGMVLRGFELLGSVLAGIGRLFKWLWEQMKSIPGLGAVVEGVEKGWGAIGSGLGGASETMGEWAAWMRGDSGPKHAKVANVFNYNINTASEDQTVQVAEDIARQASFASGYSNASFASRGQLS